ncbi:MAG: DedA family protein [Alphaproteobacteria bacterium]|nr:DedA family protein [Alphaproteobacteria bacterium]
MDYAALFLSAFVSATLVPASSEAVIAGLRLAGRDPLLLLSVATVANTLGAALNWALGRWCLTWQDRRWFPFKPDSLARATQWFRRFGSWSLLLSWLPIVGDPLTFVAGVLGVGAWRFVLLVAIGKAARYAAVLYATDAIAG